jgi:sulfur-oxidizing protein SoxY
MESGRVQTGAGPSRRAFLRLIGAFAASLGAAGDLCHGAAALGQDVLGLPLPDEKVDATLKRLFGGRKLLPGAEKIKLDLPLIAEDGANVAVAVEASLPMTAGSYVKNIYIISDQNRRPMLAKFSLTPEMGKAYVAASVRLATTTDVRAVAEMSDGTLYAASKHVRVTVGGCETPTGS